jgi:MFS family permease
VRALASALLYLLALDAVACATLAWGRVSVPRLAGWATALGVALALGERLGETFAVIERKKRERMGLFLATLQLSVLVLALVLASATPTASLLRFLAGVLSGYQLLVLLLARLTPRPHGVVGHSLALMALACLRDGPLAAWAAGSTLALVGLYVAVDHHETLLGAHRVPDGPHATRALARAALLVLPVALGVGVASYRLAPRVRPAPAVEEADEGYRPLEEHKKKDVDLRALRALVGLGLGGAVAVYALGRWMVRSRKGERGMIETPEPLVGRLERLSPGTGRAPARRRLPGRRGQVVRAYLAVVDAAERAGFPRHPHETPGEFAAALGEPQAALFAVTEAFRLARYGHYDIGGEDVARAERAATAVLEHLARHPPPRRAAVVHAVRDPAASDG